MRWGMRALSSFFEAAGSTPPGRNREIKLKATAVLGSSRIKPRRQRTRPTRPPVLPTRLADQKPDRPTRPYPLPNTPYRGMRRIGYEGVSQKLQPSRSLGYAH